MMLRSYPSFATVTVVSWFIFTEFTGLDKFPKEGHTFLHQSINDRLLGKNDHHRSPKEKKLHEGSKVEATGGHQNKG